jgi:lipopolysaccharide transport system ATP-binding protein
MSSLAIDVHSISKQYDLGERGGVLDFLRKTKSEKFWALRDISFQIREHESVGIIGSNGAGKSTLLKILSRVTAPTLGRARVRGRMGTILEVGTGFHPELTGRENVYLSGTILGMRKSEIDRRFDEIVDFAGIEKFIDTPVKRYSSGMYVRLAFAVAAHLDPDILIVDEVLAVGDVGFQKKCLAKMDSSINQEGRTIIFVSHNMQAIRSLCSRALLLQNGSLIADGSVSDVLSKYAAGQQTSFDVRERSLHNRLNRTRGHARITAFSISGPGGSQLEKWSFSTGDALELHISYQIQKPVDSLDVVISFTSAGSGEVVTSLKEVVHDRPMDPDDTGEIRIEIPRLPFRPGEFALTIGLGSNDFGIFEDILDTNVNLPHLVIHSEEDDFFRRGGLVAIDYKFFHSEKRNLRSLANTMIGEGP